VKKIEEENILFYLIRIPIYNLFDNDDSILVISLYDHYSLLYDVIILFESDIDIIIILFYDLR